MILIKLAMSGPLEIGLQFKTDAAAQAVWDEIGKQWGADSAFVEVKDDYERFVMIDLATLVYSSMVDFDKDGDGQIDQALSQHAVNARGQKRLETLNQLKNVVPLVPGRRQ